MDERVFARFVRRRAIAGLHRKDQALPTDGRPDLRLEAQGFGGYLVQRLEDRDVIARAAHRLRRPGGLGHHSVGRRRRRDLVRGDGRR
ncbi:MAG: hypothetical protein ACK53I_01540, partial [Phenylobacterium sp.]